jgi:hypothetical protein
MKDAHQVVAAYWAAAESRDWNTFADLITEQVVYEAPQTRERVRGRSAYVRFNVEGSPATGILRSRGSSGKAATGRAGSSSLMPGNATRVCVSSTLMRTDGLPGLLTSGPRRPNFRAAALTWWSVTDQVLPDSQRCPHAPVTLACFSCCRADVEVPPDLHDERITGLRSHLLGT